MHEWIKTGEWIYEMCGRENWTTCEQSYSDKEDAIKAGREHIKEMIEEGLYYNNDCLEIAQVAELDIKLHISDSAIEEAVDQAYDKVGEIAEDWLDYRYIKNIPELDDMITKAFNEWLKKYPENKPKFWAVKNREIVRIEED